MACFRSQVRSLSGPPSFLFTQLCQEVERFSEIECDGSVSQNVVRRGEHRFECTPAYHRQSNQSAPSLPIAPVTMLLSSGLSWLFVLTVPPLESRARFL